jgi:ornithine cyclodeaminase
MEPLIVNLDQINEVLAELDPIQDIEDGFKAYSQGHVVVPPVGELIFDDPPGETHIKYGFIRDDDYFVIKVATGFYENYKLGLPTGAGLMLLFHQKTGQLVAVMLDGGHLTDVRTAAAGAVAARYLAPENIGRIGVFGAGVQGKMQIQYLEAITPCRDIFVWGINQEELDAYRAEMEPKGYRIQTTLDAGEIGPDCNLIVMATPSRSPLLQTGQVQPGTHITAMGSDTAEKQELDPGIVAEADVVVADSIEQCHSRGEIYQAMKAGLFEADNMVELGNVILNPELGRTSEDQVTVADLTGVAVQDIQITKAVYQALVQGYS